MRWCTAAMTPDELWIRLPEGVSIAEVAQDFDGCGVFTVEQSDGGETRYEGYTHLINASLDKNGLTLRVSRETP